ncbi:MFS transporter [Microbacterium capsulatum]|uniref:MFS transporter n=1 Tax=Microbacterium capsulatum TaxID=3041921 RepID=A0ABU0XHM2_9MICO|nr:MFS transporter [Microbacterium sp. ASV81]MDQ4214613.1 MFS transporter [Microbacterium sp. ASV81]
MTAENVDPSPPTPGVRLSAALLRPFSSLHGNRDFSALLVSNVLFFGGVWTLSFVLGWMVFAQTGSEVLVAVFTTVRLLPLLLGPVAGAITDRMDRRRLLVIACIMAAVAVVVVAALATAGLASFWVLTAAGLLLGLAHSPSQPARAALVAERVPAEHLSNANALNALTFSVTLMIGPAIGGVAVSTLGAPAALWLCVAWFLGSLIALRWTRGGYTPPEEPHGSIWRMLWDGFHAIVRLRVVLAVLLVTIATNALVWTILQGFMPVFAREQGLDAAGLGLLLTVYGLGGIVGSFTIAALGDIRWKGAVFVIGTATMAFFWILFAVLHPPVLSAVAFTIAGLISATFGVMQTTLMLSATPPELQGRAMGLQELAIGAQPISAMVIGVVAQLIGISLTTVISASLEIVLLIVIAVAVPALMRYHGTAPEDAVPRR